MASSALVGAGGGISLCLSAVSSCSSTSASFALRSVRNYQPPGCLLALPKRGVAGVGVRRRGPFLPPIPVAFVSLYSLELALYLCLFLCGFLRIVGLPVPGLIPVFL
jgi:hypothetical protein